MKLIIAGSRTLDKYRCFYEVIRVLESKFPHVEGKDIELVTGCCSLGADQVPYLIREIEPKMVITEFPADWATLGKSAGPYRNKEMADYGDCLIAIWDGESPGTRNMIMHMRKLNKPIHEVIVNE